MCGRFSLTTSPEDLSQHFGFEIPVSFEPRDNIAPSQNILAIKADNDPMMLRWGLIPSGANDPSIGHKMIIAIAASVAEKPSLRSVYRSWWCLVPADSFNESKREGSGKQSYHIRKVDRGLFCLAELWDKWSKGEGMIWNGTTVISLRMKALYEGWLLYNSTTGWTHWNTAWKTSCERRVDLNSLFTSTHHTQETALNILSTCREPVTRGLIIIHPLLAEVFLFIVTNKKDHPFPSGLISWVEGSATYLRESNIIDVLAIFKAWWSWTSVHQL